MQAHQRMVFFHAFCFFLYSLLAGCDSGPEKDKRAPSIKADSFFNFTEKGDLPALRNRGVVRLIAPRFEEPVGLPRDGMPASSYQAQAEAFVHSLGLTPQWVYVDTYTSLIELVNAGKADIIVSNFSVTEMREQQLAFSAPVNAVQERLILPAGSESKPISEMAPFVISVPDATAYLETAKLLAKRHQHVSVEILPSDLSDQDLVDSVANGEFSSTIIDSNTMTLLLSEDSGVVAGPIVNRKRRIAWAVRKSSELLLSEINQFITSERVLLSASENVVRDWQDIQRAGVLRIITSNNPASYFMWRGELMGFDYDLMKEFAKNHHLRLSVVVKDSPSAMFEALNTGEGDVIAASMTVTKEREAAGWHFSRRYLHVFEQLVGPAGAKPFETLSDLHGIEVAVNPESAFYPTLLAVKEQGVAIRIVPVEGASSEMLINSVADDVYDYTVADSHFVAMETTYRDDIAVVYQFDEEKDIAWGLREDQSELKKALNRYIRRYYRGLYYNVTFNRYFKEKKSIASHVAHRVEAGKNLSPYDELVKQESLKYGLDWRLITSQMYQESRFNPNARSFAGALGLLQVMPRTGKQFGYTNLTDPENGIAAGLAYLDWLEARFPADLDLAEKLYFTLASYNAGYGHVSDARTLARRLGKDPDQWFGNVEEAMLLLAKPQYARQARYGYVRGSEPVKYVQQIQERYLAYVSALESSAEN